MMKKDRSRYDIILEILKVTREEEKAKKTRIMHKASLDWRNFKRYFDFLIAEGFIKNCNDEYDFYELTDKGKNLLQRLKAVNELVDAPSRIGNQFQNPARIYSSIGHESAITKIK